MPKAPTNRDSLKALLDPATIEVVIRDHLARCERCRLVDVRHSATLANSCPEGAQYFKVLLEKNAAADLKKSKAAEAQRAKQFRGEFYASTKKVRDAMRYK